MVAEREKLTYRSRYGKMLGSARAFARVLRNPRRFFVSIETDGKTVVRRTAGVVVSNNPLGKGHMPYADTLDKGVLGLYVTTARGWAELVRVTAAAAFGAAEESPLVEYVETTIADIDLGRAKVGADHARRRDRPTCGSAQGRDRRRRAESAETQGHRPSRRALVRRTRRRYKPRGSAPPGHVGHAVATLVQPPT